MACILPGGTWRSRQRQQRLQCIPVGKAKENATDARKPQEGDSSPSQKKSGVLMGVSASGTHPAGIWEDRQSPGKGRVTLGGYHALAGVSHTAGLVQEAAILQLLTEPLQCVERLVELHRHRHLGQVFADVVTQDIPKAHICSRPTGSWQAAAARGSYSNPWNTRPWANAVTLVSLWTLMFRYTRPLHQDGFLAF